MTSHAHSQSPDPVPAAVVPARLDHGPGIHALVTYWAEKGDMLHRPLAEVYESIREFKVIEQDDRVTGCAALHVFDPGLAEIRSIAVDETMQGAGLGAQLVRACLEEAEQLGIARVFALTYRPGFFERHGFRLANVMEFPQKVWKECVRCPFFTNCQEVAVVYELAPSADEPIPLLRPSERQR